MHRPADPRRPFPLLADAGSYVACHLDLRDDDRRRAYWLGLFRWHFPMLLAEAAKALDAEDIAGDEARRRIEQARAAFMGYLDRLEREPGHDGRLDILRICERREQVLRSASIADPYHPAKRRENEAALALLPAALRQIDALPTLERWERVTRGVFAGNIFDLGATKTVEMFTDKTVDFAAVLGKLKPRPWLIDDFDAWIARMTTGPAHRCAALFVDNAGCDVLLGMLPLARELLKRGTGVILTANPHPSLNDITHDELTELVNGIAGWDPLLGGALRDGRLDLVPSGNDVPLIDLARVSPALCEAVVRRGVDLVVLEGMGRAVESNLDARVACDVLKIAMVKDEGVAEVLGGSLYDLVLRFERGRG